MNIKDNTEWEHNPSIWIEENEFEINIEKDEVEIICDWDYGWGGRGTERMTIDRKQLIELLSKMDRIKQTDK